MPNSYRPRVRRVGEESFGEESGTPPARLSRFDRVFGKFLRSKSSATGHGQATGEHNNVEVLRDKSRLLETNSGHDLAVQSKPGTEHNLHENSRENPSPGLEDASESAYQKALSRLEEAQQQKLAAGKNINELFTQLNQAGKQRHKKSPFAKGFAKVGPYLEKLRITIDFISPFTSVEPVAATALGLVKGVVTMVIAIHGAVNELTSHVQNFLERIPAIERCNEAFKNKWSEAAYEILVKIYVDLLQFFLQTIDLFEGSNFVLQYALHAFRSKLPPILSSFNGHVDTLAKFLEIETFVTLQEIRDEQIETLIRDTLNSNREYESEYHNELQKRADEACSWITSDVTYLEWILNSSGPRLLKMIGNIGLGKTINTAYLVDHLSQDRPVCVYYCKDDRDITKLGSIYRSLTWQLLMQKPDFKGQFRDWYERTKSRSKIDPTQSESLLRAFIVDSVSGSKQWIFLVLDGLDECEFSSRTELLRLMEDLLEQQALLKIFISSGYHEEIERSMASVALQIRINQSEERGRAIAIFIASQVGLPREIHEKVADQLVPMAQGSALWLKLAIEYLGKLHMRNMHGVKKALQSLPSSKGIAELYSKLFEKTCLGLHENEIILQQALETLAVAYRPLTLGELNYAVHIGFEDSNEVITMAQLDELSTEVNLMEFIRPFVTVAGEPGNIQSRVRLLHQSLKDLILQATPAGWKSLDASVSKTQTSPRRAELNAHLLRRCLKYLSLEECGSNSLFPVRETAVEEGLLFEIGPVFDDTSDNASTATTASAELPQDFDPVGRGLGLFFSYAASYWTQHFSEATAELRPSTMDLVTLCSKGSRRLDNWTEQWKRPSCSYFLEYSFPETRSRLDPLVITALFGSPDSVADMMKYSNQADHFLPDTLWISVEHLMKRDMISTIKEFVMDLSLGATLCQTEFFYQVALLWREPDCLQSRFPGWEDIFGFLIQKLRDEVLRSGNRILCEAAHHGCLVLVRKLFEAADSDEAVREAILKESHWRQGTWETTIAAHQSVGEAAYGGHTNTIRFLCEQRGIEPHLKYVNSHGKTVFHQAARLGKMDNFNILLQRWPDGANLRDGTRDTPLNLLIFGRAINDEGILETVSQLIATGRVDATGSGDDRGNSPLCIAARQGNLALCRVLVVEGSADLSDVLCIEPKTGEPFLQEEVDTRESVEDRQKLLEGLEALVPKIS